MKTQYKTLLFMAVTIGFAIFLSAMTHKNKPNGVKNTINMPQAYENLITYQDGDMAIFETQAVGAKKVENFKKSVRSKTNSRFAIPNGDKSILTYDKSDPTKFFQQNLKEGKLAFNKGMSEYLDNGGRSLPAQEKADEFALTFLNESGLAPANKKELKMMHSGGMRTSKAGSTKQIDVMRTITYGRMLNGVPVYGPSSKIIVHVGNKGEIIGVNSLWKDVKKEKGKTVSKNAMKSAKEAEKEMNLRLATDFGKGTKTEIKDMYLAYYDEGKNYIQPAYYFNISVVMPRVKESPTIKFNYMGVVPALKRTPEPFEVLQQSPEAKKTIKKSSRASSMKDRKKTKRDIE